MKILHTISNLDIKSGGPSQSVFSLVSNTRRQGYQIDIVTSKPSIKDTLIANENYIYLLENTFYRRFGYIKGLKEFLENHPYDLYYCNGLWQYPSHAAAKYAQKRNKPYVVMPHGMLYPSALQKSTWIKKIALQLYQDNDIKQAAAIHATCIQEMNHIRNLGYTNPIAVIPNSINLKIPYQDLQIEKSKKQVGFIGRIVPIKNLEILIQSWFLSGKKYLNWELVIIGDGDQKYVSAIKSLIKKLEIKNIRFTGFLTGYDKEIALRSLDYLVLPSKSENFGMVVPEALLRKIPVIASKGTPWEELNMYNAGWWIDSNIESLSTTLDKAIQLSHDQYEQMGYNGEYLIKERYSSEAVANKMIAFYNWISGNVNKPEFVYG